jgi:hypothetical protein
MTVTAAKLNLKLRQAVIYIVTMRRVHVTIVAVENQILLFHGDNGGTNASQCYACLSCISVQNVTV